MSVVAVMAVAATILELPPDPGAEHLREDDAELGEEPVLVLKGFKHPLVAYLGCYLNNCLSFIDG